MPIVILDPDLSNNTAPVVMQVDIDVDVSELDPEVPAAFHPHQNYLNPFDPDATIPFAVKEPVHVVPTVYDVLGERVAMLVDAAYTPGHYELRFDARDQAYDAYLCRPEMGNFQAIWTTATVE